jgi:hypothetical protein
MLCEAVGTKDGKQWRRRKAKRTEVVEGDRRVRENQNLGVSCTDFVHAWSPSRSEFEVTVYSVIEHDNRPKSVSV